jgi:hypothetical protein
MNVEKQKRMAVVRQFELQASKLGFSIVSRHGFTFRVQDQGKSRELVACALACTFDFYEFRLAHGQAALPDLLIVQEHDALSPVRVLCLRTGRLYDPAVAALAPRPERKRRNGAEAKVLVSGLLIGDRGALAALQEMPARTRQYYQARCQELLKGRQGRPWAS